jgi:hypothetical protein
MNPAESRRLTADLAQALLRTERGDLIDAVFAERLTLTEALIKALADAGKDTRTEEHRRVGF